MLRPLTSVEAIASPDAQPFWPHEPVLPGASRPRARDYDLPATGSCNAALAGTPSMATTSATVTSHAYDPVSNESREQSNRLVVGARSNRLTAAIVGAKTGPRAPPIARLLAAEDEGLATTPAGRVYSWHYLTETGPDRNIPGSIVDETIDNATQATQLGDRTVYYDAKNDVTVVQSDTTGKIMSARKGVP